ncbi:MAG TPA: hypothetical protein VHQ70_05820 [Syntrophomonadaceae bacterium]|nr:hypothetical protein [Syntrophomonadaceae bacterium]
MTTKLISVYRNIVEQVIIIEGCKKEISRSLLLIKEPGKKIKQVYNFLSYDLEKHRLLEYAAMMAINEGDGQILRNLQKFYSYTDGADLMDKISTEITCILRYLEILHHEIKNKGSSDFVERRMIQEICKYVIAMARMYGKNTKYKK